MDDGFKPSLVRGIVKALDHGVYLRVIDKFRLAKDSARIPPQLVRVGSKEYIAIFTGVLALWPCERMLPAQWFGDYPIVSEIDDGVFCHGDCRVLLRNIDQLPQAAALSFT